MGPQPKEDHQSCVQCKPDGRGGRVSGLSDSCCHKLALWSWNVTSLAGKDPELEQYQLVIVGLTYPQLGVWNPTPGDRMDLPTLELPREINVEHLRCGDSHESLAEYLGVGVFPGEQEGSLSAVLGYRNKDCGCCLCLGTIQWFRLPGLRVLGVSA